jgi:putative endonuclease
VIFRHARNKTLGKEGENLAAEFLKKNGYRILERNYRTRRGEIDIVCEHKGFIVFVEVKTRKSLAFGGPEEAVDRRKRNKIFEVATHYLMEKSLLGKADCRFDVVTILKNGSRSMNHTVDAFGP